jgi:hypothetical protein
MSPISTSSPVVHDADGRLGRERLRVAKREFAAGDRIVCLSCVRTGRKIA